jgi:hypothetical protein
MAKEVTIEQSEQNGDMPPDHVAASVAFIIEQSRGLREKRDTLRAQRQAIADELAVVAQELGRYDKAIKALTGVPMKAGRAQSEQKKVKAARTLSPKDGDRAITNARDGYPAVSEAKQQEVYNALKSLGRPASVGDLVAETEVARSLAGNALAHLRARGLVRWAGKQQGSSGHLYAIYEDGDTEVED